MPARVETITVTKKLRVHETQNGNCFLECYTSLGLVAFWGKAGNMRNIQALGPHVEPFSVKCACRDANKDKFPKHSVWVPETSALEFVGPAGKG